MGCPYCSGRVVTEDNNFEMSFPEVAEMWNSKRNFDRPSDFLPKSNKKVWWMCNRGHEYKATIANMVGAFSEGSKAKGCPYCSKKKVTNDNNLEVLFPEVAAIWNYDKNGDLEPSSFAPKSGKKVWWVCESGHEYESTIAHVTTSFSMDSQSKGCPYCSGMKAAEDNNLEILFPDVSKMWNYERNGDLAPSDFLPKSNKKVWWVCEDGHEYCRRVSTATSGAQCPGCKRRKQNDRKTGKH